MRKTFIYQMTRLTTLILIVGAMLFFHTQASAQSVTLNIAHADIDQLSIGDIDFQTLGSQHWFFTLTASGAPQKVRIKASLRIDLADGSFSGEAMENPMCTVPFSIPRTVTNLDIGKNSDVKLEPGFRFNDEATNKIKNIALSTGKLPAGTYTFIIDLRQDDASKCDAPSALSSGPQTIVINIRNFSRLDLISPVNESNAPNGFPLLQWIYDGDSVEVTVAEVSAHSHSNEEAISGIAMLKVSTGSALLPHGSHILQYPSAGAGVRPLEIGKTYVWQVKGLSKGTGGAGYTINSEIWKFTVGASVEDQSSQNQGGTMSALQFLAGLNADVLKLLASGDWQMTGVIMLNGRPISAAEILRILSDLGINPDKIIDIQIVSR